MKYGSEEKQNLFSYLLEISYLGKEFEGFQSQPSNNTVQDHLEKALSTVLRNPVKVTGGSRTDSGVDCYHQYVQVVCPQENIESEKFLLSVNALCPAAIRVYGVKRVPRDFRLHDQILYKIYRYRLWKGRCFDPFLASHVWACPKELSFESLNTELQYFQGKHDFASLQNVGTTLRSTVRNVHGIELIDQGPLADIWVWGDGFLKQMVRNLVGTCVDLAMGRLDLSAAEVLEGRDRHLAGQTAPAAGLALVRTVLSGSGTSPYEHIDSFYGRQSVLAGQVRVKNKP